MSPLAWWKLGVDPEDDRHTCPLVGYRFLSDGGDSAAQEAVCIYVYGRLDVSGVVAKHTVTYNN